jgi:Ca2+-binding RTX toxin-like protein
VQSYFSSKESRVEKVSFADGTTWSVTDIAKRQMGSSGNDNFTGIRDLAHHMQGLAGNDTLRGGDLADTLDGGADADTLIGGAGNDTLVGGTGNDSLDGGAGNDTYLFNQGDGADTISEYEYDSQGTGAGTSDELKLGTGLTVAGTVVGRVGNDLTLSWGSTDKVTVQSYFSSKESRVEKVSFADGTTWSVADIAKRQVGSSGNDNFTGIRDAVNHMQGLAGNDTLRGGDLADSLDGGAGNDSLEGGAGNDSLAGGTGNDTLNGGTGNDTYIFNQGDGADTISDYEYDSQGTGAGTSDELKLGTGLTVAGTVLGRVGNDLTLSWGKVTSAAKSRV